MFIFGLLFRLLPFVGPLGILLGFLPRLLKLKREKAVIAAAEKAGIPTDPFPVSSQVEIDNHTVRLHTAGWRLAAGLGFAGTLIGGGFTWYEGIWKNHYKDEVAIEKGKTLMAQNDANQRYNDYTDIKGKYDTLVNLQGAASAKRETLITLKTAKKIEGAKRAAKLPPATIVDAADWLRIESAPRGDASPGPVTVPNS